MELEGQWTDKLQDKQKLYLLIRKRYGFQDIARIVFLNVSFMRKLL